MGCNVSLLFGSKKNVGRDDVGAERTGWRFANFPNRVNAAGWTFREIAFRIKFEVRLAVWVKIMLQVRLDVAHRDNVVGFPIVFQSPLVFRRINPTEVVDTGIAFSSRTIPSIAYKIWNCYQSEDSDYASQDKYLTKTKSWICYFFWFTHTID